MAMENNELRSAPGRFHEVPYDLWSSSWTSYFLLGGGLSGSDIGRDQNGATAPHSSRALKELAVLAFPDQ